jgi:LmbE family N-acetylglucosaminyl deacetylase
MNRTFQALLLLSLILFPAAFLFAQTNLAPPLPPPDPRYKADILLIIAHPDDETDVTSYLARAVYDEHKTVAVAYTTCGGAGGDTVSLAQGRSLCAEREIEARRAFASLGVMNVWFLGGLDTPGVDVLDSLGHWNHGAVLENAVRIVRLTRPEVVITWIPAYLDGENHDDHQAAAVIATEAFDLAGDPTVFPEQVAAPRDYLQYNNLTEGLDPWQPEKLYWFTNAAHQDFVNGQGPTYSSTDVSPSQHIPYYQMAARSASFHLTQLPTGPQGEEASYQAALTYFQRRPTRFILAKSLVNSSITGDIFEGVVRGPIPFHPVSGYHPQDHQGLSIELGGPWQFYRRFWLAHDISRLAALVPPEAGVGDDQSLTVPVNLRNDTSTPAKITLAAALPAGWKVTSGLAIYPVAPHNVYPAWLVFVSPPGSRPEWQTLNINAESDGKSVGSISFRVSYGTSGP